MSVEVNKKGWAKILKFFSDQNQGRLTRLGVFKDANDAATDEWIEIGLPLLGIDADTREGSAAAVEIMLGDTAQKDARHYTHNILNAQQVRLYFSPDGSRDAVKIEDAEGTMTVLRFEN